MAQRVRKLARKVLVFITPAILFATTFGVLYSLERSQPLIHDEAVYLTKSRELKSGTPADEFRIYRPIGMAFAGRAIFQFDESESAARLFGVFFGAVTIVFVYFLFKGMFGYLVGVIVAVSTMSSMLFLKNAPQFLNDIPSSGLMFGCLWVIWDWYKTKGKGRLIYLFAPFAAVAFYLRYGVASTIVIIILVSFFVLYRNANKHILIGYGKIFDVLFLSAVLFTPHFIESVVYTNNLLGILMRSGNAAGRQYLGEGLVGYLRSSPEQLGGYIVIIFAVIGLVFILYSLISKKFRDNRIGFFWLGMISLGAFLLTGTLVHAEPRYIFFSLVIFSGLGIAIIFSLFQKVKYLSVILAILYFGIFAPLSYKNYQESAQFLRDKVSGSARLSYVNASQFINNEKTRGDQECVIWAAIERPEFSWYTGCYTLAIDDREKFKKDFLINMRRAKYSVVFSKVDDRQLDEKVAGEFNVKLEKIFEGKKSGAKGKVTIYKVSGDELRFESDVEKE